MIFLIEYDRRHGKIVQLREYADSERSRSEESRIELELEPQMAESEIVLLEASSEEELRRTHARYFETPSELMTADSDDSH